jgi:hypothetical protein
MLFDLRGRRRRAVQATYLTLALLMGGGLVLFGVGSDATGGLLNAIGVGGESDPNDAIEKRIDRNEERLAQHPRDVKVLKVLMRDNYQLASTQIDPNTSVFPPDARDELRKAASYWQRYLKTKPKKLDFDMAAFALQVYDQGALNQPRQAQEIAALAAEEANDPQSYLQLVKYAAQAGDTRTADLAEQKAVDLAPRDQRQAVRDQAKQLKQPQAPGG